MLIKDIKGIAFFLRHRERLLQIFVDDLFEMRRSLKSAILLSADPLTAREQAKAEEARALARVRLDRIITRYNKLFRLSLTEADLEQ